MAYQAGKSNLSLLMTRVGFAFDSTPSAFPIEFTQSIYPGEIKEDWNEAVSIFHNPNAKFPLDVDLFENIRQTWINKDGDIDGTTPKFFPFNSKTVCGIIE